MLRILKIITDKLSMYTSTTCSYENFFSLSFNNSFLPQQASNQPIYLFKHVIRVLVVEFK